MKARHSALLLFFGILLSLVVFSPHDSSTALAEEVYRVREITELRDNYSDTFQLSDGTRECVIYSEKKYYAEKDGSYQPVDNSIRACQWRDGEKQYDYRNQANDFLTYFSAKEAAISLSAPKAGRLNMVLQRAGAVRAVPGGIKGKRIGDYYLYGENTILYSSVLTDTDLLYTVQGDGLKEYIILNSPKAPRRFEFRIEAEGMILKKTEEGRLAFFDQSGEMVYILGSLFAVDSAGRYTDQVFYEVQEQKGNVVTLAVTIAEKYVTDSGRQYPILIDPSIMLTGGDVTYDTFVSSKFPNTNYYLDNFVRTGRDDDLYVRRAYVRFLLPSHISGNNVITACYKIRQYIGTTPVFRAYRVTGSWTSSLLTWNNKPGFTTAGKSAVATLGSDNWYNIYITDFVRGWLNGTYPDYGFMLKDDMESGTSRWSTFWSSDSPSPNKPELHITYRQPSYQVISYVDQGYRVRFLNPMNKLEQYQTVVKNRFAEIFDLNVQFTNYTYTSAADNCKIARFGSVKKNNLASFCNHATNHTSTPILRSQLINDKGVGSPTLTRVLWTGHIMSNHTDDRSNSNGGSHTVIITPVFLVNEITYANLIDSAIRIQSMRILMHELSHQLGAPDHYCYGELGDLTCGNPYCYKHVYHLNEQPYCIMSNRSFDLDSHTGNLYCDECYNTILEHIWNHH